MKGKKCVGVIILGIVLVCIGIAVWHSVWGKNPLSKCEISPYEVSDYRFSRQRYVVASYPVNVYENANFGEGESYAIEKYVVEKQDAEGNYRTVYDSSKDAEVLVRRNPYSHMIYLEMTLQPLVDIYGDGEYRVLKLSEEKVIIAHAYYVVSGQHLLNKERFGDVFPITREDLQNLEIRNGQVTYDLTEEERETFIDFILNMKLASVNEQQHSQIMSLVLGSFSTMNYHIALNIPGEESCYIYNMVGKDLDGNEYQAVFVSGETAVCLNSDEKLLYLLDAVKQNANKR